MEITPEIIVAVIIFIGGLVTNIISLVNSKSQGKKAEMEASSLVLDMALKLNKELKEEIDSKKRQIEELEKKLEKCKTMDDLVEELEVTKLALESLQCEYQVQKEKLKSLGEK